MKKKTETEKTRRPHALLLSPPSLPHLSSSLELWGQVSNWFTGGRQKVKLTKRQFKDNLFPSREYVPKEETFPFPLKFIDVKRSTCADLDVGQEKRIDDYWNVDEDRRLSDSWTGFTKFTSTKRDTCKRIHVVTGGDRQKFKQPLDQIIFGQRLGQKLG